MQVNKICNTNRVYKITAGHWPFSEQISKVATQNLDQLRLNP